MSSKKSRRIAEAESRVDQMRAAYAAAEKMVTTAGECREEVAYALVRAVRELRQLRELPDDPETP